MKRRLAGNSKSIQGPQLDVQATEDGILISLTDRQNFSMFAIGSAEPQLRVLHMMEAIAASLKSLQGAIVVRGYTDARPYRSATYDNWRLSSARAQMAYYMLDSRRPAGETVRASRRVCGPSPERHIPSARGRKSAHRNSGTRGQVVTLPWLDGWGSARVLAPVAAFADSAKISDLIDEMQRIQVRIAQGDKAAYPAQLNQLKTIGAAIATASPEIWKNKREADSLVIYILSGGSLSDVAPLLKGDAIVESELPLARGALAYVTNHEADSIDLLGERDLTALDPRLAGEVAFARSVLETKRNAEGGSGSSRLVAPACAGRIGRGGSAQTRDRPPCRGEGRDAPGDVNPTIRDPFRGLALRGGFLPRSRWRRRSARTR